MKKKLLFILSYIIFIFNSNVLTSEKNNILKVGLLAPLSGKYAELGNSLLYSLQLALAEINDKSSNSNNSIPQANAESVDEKAEIKNQENS